MPRYWLSFDLGLRGNYEGLYQWLDNLKARECGDSAATFVSDISPDEMKKQLSKIAGPSGRAYLVFTVRKFGKTEGVRGKFILGRRKA
ncbi:MAG: hypothetical protein ACREQN_15490, partial [Candidatus Binataceae bacterium]